MSNATETGWDLVRGAGIAGTGNWHGFNIQTEAINRAAEDWRAQVGSADKLWLCWNLSSAWSRLQQRMILEAGWTPVVGHDPNCMPRSLDVVPGAIGIDFNSRLKLPLMWPHFPLEFAFMWAPRLAFWHADLLMPMPLLQSFAKKFTHVPDGSMAAIFTMGGRRNFFRRKMHRYWELIGCTTAQASRDQFSKGCGWWRCFSEHPNTPAVEKKFRSSFYYDSGVGIVYWERYCNGKVIRLSERDVAPGHCSEIGYSGYRKAKHKGEELDMNFSLPAVAERFNLSRLLD